MRVIIKYILIIQYSKYYITVVNNVYSRNISTTGTVRTIDETLSFTAKTQDGAQLIYDVILPSHTVTIGIMQD